MKYHIAFLYCAFLAAIALSGYAYCDETPSILECKPYIEKALKDHIEGGVSESTILENISGETAHEDIQSTEDVQQLDSASVEIVTEASESEEKQQHDETTENTDQESSEEVTNSGEQGQDSEESKENVQDDKSAEEENAQSTEHISDSGEQGLETQASEEHLTAEENVSEAEHIETIESVVEPSASHEENIAEESSTEMMQDQPAEEIPVEEEQVEETQSEEHVEEAQSVEHAEEHVEEEHTEEHAEEEQTEEQAEEEHTEEHAEEHAEEEHTEDEHAEEEHTEGEHTEEEHTEEEHTEEEQAEEHVEEEHAEEITEEEHVEEEHVKDESVEEGHVEEQVQEDSEDELKQVQDEDQVQEEHADEESVVSSETTIEKESVEDQEQAQLASEEQVKEETVSVEEEEVATAQASVEAQEEVKESEETATESETTGEDAVEQINAEEEKSKETEEQEEVQSEGEVQEEKETNPEDDLTKETIIPEVLRQREHIGELLGLGEEMAEKDLVTAKAIDVTLRELKRLSDTAIKPLETLYKYRDLSNRHFGDPEIFSKPLVLFMGPWSGGKSTMINYLLNNEYNETALRTGAEPSPAYFNIVMWGAEAEVLDGTQLAADWTFSGLQKFGQGLEDRLRGLKLPNKLLEKVNIVEIPGILEVRKQVSRVFPFNDACQWFIDRADIIFLVYDPSKLDVGPETEAILDQLKGREYQTRIILNKADIVKPEELMRVQGALIWNISPLMSSLQPPVMYTTSLWSVPYQSGSPERLLYAQERSFLRDLRQAIERRVENKIASARRFAVRVRNHAKMVDCYLTTYYNHKTLFGNRKMISDEIIEHPQEYHIYEGLSTLTNISRYDLPDPDVYRDFFKLNPLYEFQQLSSTCTYFRGCPINRLDIAIAYDLPELVGKYKKMIEPISNKPASHS